MTDFYSQFDAGLGFTGEVADTFALAYPEEDWFFNAVTWGQSDSGEHVTPSTALSHGPVWQAVNILAGDIGQLPIQVYRKNGRERRREDKHQVDWLLTNEPNPYQTPAVFKETLVAWSLLWGNGCAYIARDGAGRPQFLIPLLPDRTRPVSVELETEDGGKYTEWMIETDFGDGKREYLAYADVFHLRGLATDGFWGLSCVQVAKNVIGGGLALRKHGNRTFKNGTRPGMVLSMEGREPAPEVRANYRRELEAMHAGSENAGRWLLLWGGAKANPMTMSNEDAQWLQALGMDREFVAGLFNLPPYKLGAMENSAVRANLEQQNRDYLQTSLSRHLNKFREEGERKLFNYSERRLRRVFLKWITEAFLRGDLQARGNYYSQAVTGEWMTKNEIRELEDLPPIEGGDELRNPAINPARDAPSDEPPQREPEPEPAEEARSAARELIAKQATALLRVESLAAEQKIPTAKNAVKWAENYYENYVAAAAEFLDVPCRLAASLGCDVADWRSVAADHARDALNRFLSLAGIAGKDDLPEIAAEFAKSIRDDKGTFVPQLLGGRDA